MIKVAPLSIKYTNTDLADLLIFQLRNQGKCVKNYMSKEKKNEKKKDRKRSIVPEF